MDAAAASSGPAGADGGGRDAAGAGAAGAAAAVRPRSRHGACVCACVSPPPFSPFCSGQRPLDFTFSPPSPPSFSSSSSSLPPQTADIRRSEMAKLHRRKQSHGVVSLDDGTYDVSRPTTKSTVLVSAIDRNRPMQCNHPTHPTPTHSPSPPCNPTVLRSGHAAALPPDGALHGALGEIQLPHLPVSLALCVCVSAAAVPCPLASCLQAM
jgi:hypothetical protein